MTEQQCREIDCPQLQRLRERMERITSAVRRCQSTVMVEKRLREEAENRLLIDPLTEAHNRRGLEQKFTEELSKAQRFKRALFMLFLDVDNFKAFNTDYGEQTGDTVLRDVVKVIKARQRPYDSVHRIGGEEFVVLLPEINAPEDACRVAERIRTGVAGMGIAAHNNGDRLRVTVSIGVAQLGPDDNVDTLIDKANRAEMEAKKNGKNRTFVFHEGVILPVEALVGKEKEKEK
jgi:diguanylate cyclase (GGDEF)-like protein